MKSTSKNPIAEVLDWCGSVLGPCEIASDDSREHAGRRASSIRLHTRAGRVYAKIHRDPAHWDSEVHGYEQWAAAFGSFAPRLLAVRDVEPLALILSEIPGQILEGMQLTPVQERGVWTAAGQRLAALHKHATGVFFGPCHRDGSPAAPPITDARDYLAYTFSDLLERGARIDCLSANERAITNTILGMAPAFANERPFPCHRDYCPANWLIDSGGRWTGVIDFEFSYWDLRAVDFARLPGWEWVTRPDLMDAFFAGYGRDFTSAEKQQRLVACGQYALGAIVWGEENEYLVFANEGREALKHLGRLME